MRRSALVAWTICVVTLLLLAVGAGVVIATWSLPMSPGLVPRGVNLLLAPIYAVLGAVIVTRVPSNAIGYLFLLQSAIAAPQCLAEQAAYAAEIWPSLVPLAPWAASAYYLLGLVDSFGPTLFLIALFPSGRFSANWEKLAAIAGTVAALLAALAAFTIIERLPVPFVKYANPLASAELGAGRYVIGVVATIVTVIALGAVLAGAVQRFRRSRGIERQQLKWFAYAAALTATVAAALWVVTFGAYLAFGQSVFDEPPLGIRLVALLAVPAFAVIPIAVAIAILRHRLYQIDFLINRTVVYVTVTGILAIIFAVLSTLAERAFEALTGQRADILTIVIAFGVAIGFAPLRARIQPVVDRVLPSRGVLALLMTDIVGSTERVVALGDERWRTVLEAYRAAVRRELARFRGHEVDTAGDGFFATFDHPAQAVNCAMALRGSLRTLGLDSRIGLHAGECELRGERVSGLNVVVTARIMATAGPNEIVTSSALRDLVTTAGFRFRDGRVEALKGVPGEWPLSVLTEEAAVPAR